MSTIKANAILDAAGGNTATINGKLPIALADIPAAPASGIQTFTASDSIAAGNGVSLNADGTVRKVQQITNSLDKSFSMASTTSPDLLNHYPVSNLNNGDINTGIFPLSSTTFLSVLRQNGGTYAMYARIITLAANGTATYGTPTLISIPQTYNIDKVVQIAPDKIAMFFDTDSLKTYIIVGQVSGSTISFGSYTLFQSGYSVDMHNVISNNNGTFIVAYSGAASAYNLIVQAFSTSGTTVSVGSAVTIKSGAPSYANSVLAYDPANDAFLLVAVGGSALPYNLGGWALKVSGTTITAGSQQNLFGTITAWARPAVMYNSSLGRFVVLNPLDTATTARLYTATISATTITVSDQSTALSFASPTGFIAAGDGNLLLDQNGTGTLYKVTVDPANSYKPIITALKNTGVLTASSTAIGTSGVYAYNGSSGGTQVVNAQGLTSITPFVGVAIEAATTGQPVKVALTGGGGVATGLSGLLTSTYYYYNNFGTLVTSGGAANAGLAASATTLLQI